MDLLLFFHIYYLYSIIIVDNHHLNCRPCRAGRDRDRSIYLHEVEDLNCEYLSAVNIIHIITLILIFLNYTSIFFARTINLNFNSQLKLSLATSCKNSVHYIPVLRYR
jgi:hypothetical protein